MGLVEAGGGRGRDGYGKDKAGGWGQVMHGWGGSRKENRCWCGVRRGQVRVRAWGMERGHGCVIMVQSFPPATTEVLCHHPQRARTPDDKE